MDLKQKLQEQATAIVQQVGTPISILSDAASSLNLKELADRLRQTKAQLENDTFKVIVLGKFKTGKSTFLNALLGRSLKPIPELEDGPPLPTDELPATAILTNIRYADVPFVKAWRFDGRSEPWKLGKYKDDAMVKISSEETLKFFENIREFEMGYPSELLQAGITLIDSPGVDDEQGRTNITEAEIPRCDAAIVVYNTSQFAGQSEREFVRRVEEGGLDRYFTVVNRMNERAVDERLRGFVWDRIVRSMHGGTPYAGQTVNDFRARRIYFVDALQAMKGRYNGDAQAVADSGLALLEQDLGDFLQRERTSTKIDRHVRGLSHLIDQLRAEADKRIASLQMDQKQFEGNLKAIYAQIEEMGRRQNRLPAIFERARKDSTRDILASYELLMSGIERTLEDEMIARDLPSLNSESSWMQVIKSSFAQKQLSEEASNAANEIIKAKVEDWRTNEIQRVMARAIEEMERDIRAEVVAIDKILQQINDLQLGFEYSTLNGQAEGVGVAERAVWAAIGVALQSPDLILTGGTRGWAGVKSTLLIELAGIGVAVATGLIIFVPISAIAAIVFNMVTGRDKIPAKVKQKTARMLIEGRKGKDASESIPSMSERVVAVRPVLESAIAEMFKKIQGQVLSQVQSLVDIQNQSIEEQRVANSKGQHEREIEIARVQDIINKIEKSKHALDRANTASKQLQSSVN